MVDTLPTLETIMQDRTDDGKSRRDIPKAGKAAPSLTVVGTRVRKAGLNNVIPSPFPILDELGLDFLCFGFPVAFPFLRWSANASAILALAARGALDSAACCFFVSVIVSR